MVRGQNNEFHLLIIERKSHMIDGTWIANYYTVEIVSKHNIRQVAVAPTPEQAVTRCLAKYGITFR